MRILISGTSGLIGSAVAPYLASQGHEVVRLVRRAPCAGEVESDTGRRYHRRGGPQ